MPEGLSWNILNEVCRKLTMMPEQVTKGLVSEAFKKSFYSFNCNFTKKGIFAALKSKT
jgi:hypothetical protein